MKKCISTSSYIVGGISEGPKASICGVIESCFLELYGKGQNVFWYMGRKRLWIRAINDFSGHCCWLSGLMECEKAGVVLL